VERRSTFAAPGASVKLHRSIGETRRCRTGGDGCGDSCKRCPHGACGSILSFGVFESIGFPRLVSLSAIVTRDIVPPAAPCGGRRLGPIGARRPRLPCRNMAR
jgi:hypothetical protein